MMLSSKKYNLWRHDESGSHLVRTTSYSLPASLHAHIDVVQPTTMFSRFNPLASTLHNPDAPRRSAFRSYPPSESSQRTAASSPVDPSCNGEITIKCLQQLYNMGEYTPQVPEKNGIGITGYLEQYANLEDLRLFYEDQRPDALNGTFEVVSIAGASLLVSFSFSVCPRPEDQ